ncbi:MAG: DUF4384 domain-containing protein [Acidobacteriaceae bacterium]|nr:DUF4384 domain-containing protein [Acidobacteriaceae bacterium]
MTLDQRSLAAVTLLAAIALPCHPQDRASRMEITVERKDGKTWKAVDPALVLNTGDVIRFRFKSSFDGYLYVTDYGTSGRYTLLFPRQETGQQNVVEAGKEYLIPATDTVFRVSGPAGYESVFWLISPVSLGSEMAPPRPTTHHSPTMTPRCDVTAMQSRGLCLDSQAGPRQVQDGDKLPDDLDKLRSNTARELTIVRKENQSVVSTPGSTASPLLYEFRLAHK